MTEIDDLVGTERRALLAVLEDACWQTSRPERGSGSAEIVLDQMAGPRFRSSLPPGLLAPGLLDGLALSATDADWSPGAVPPSSGAPLHSAPPSPGARPH